MSRKKTEGRVRFMAHMYAAGLIYRALVSLKKHPDHSFLWSKDIDQAVLDKLLEIHDKLISKTRSSVRVLKKRTRK